MAKLHFPALGAELTVLTRGQEFQTYKNKVCHLPKALDENVTKLHIPPSVQSSPSLLRNKHITLASRLKCKVHSRVLSLPACSMHTSQYSDGENRRGSRSGRTLRGSSSSAGRPRHESSIAKNYFEIELDREELFAIELDMD